MVARRRLRNSTFAWTLVFFMIAFSVPLLPLLSWLFHQLGTDVDLPLFSVFMTVLAFLSLVLFVGANRIGHGLHSVPPDPNVRFRHDIVTLYPFAMNQSMTHPTVVFQETRGTFVSSHWFLVPSML